MVIKIIPDAERSECFIKIFTMKYFKANITPIIMIGGYLRAHSILECINR